MNCYVIFRCSECGEKVKVLLSEYNKENCKCSKCAMDEYHDNVTNELDAIEKIKSDVIKQCLTC